MRALHGAGSLHFLGRSICLRACCKVFQVSRNRFMRLIRWPGSFRHAVVDLKSFRRFSHFEGFVCTNPETGNRAAAT
eukprot:4228391-Alexandrium_andersonii.AAC.1